MALTKVTSGVRTLAADEVGATEIAAGAVGATEIASTFDISSKTVTLPETSVTAHVTAFNDASIRNDIATLALHSAIADNKAAHNLSNSFIDQFEDDTGLDNQTDVDRDTTAECIASVVSVADTYTVLLVPSDKTSLSTDIVDISATPHTITLVNSAAPNNSPSHRYQGYMNVLNVGGRDLGDSSIYYDKDQNAYITIPSSTDFNMTGAFTIEYWIYLNGWASDNDGIMGMDTSTSGGPSGGGNGGSTAYFSIDNSCTGNTNVGIRWGGSIQDTGHVPSTATWYHHAVTRDASDACNFWVNGTSVSSWTNANDMPNARFHVGMAGNREGFFHMTELRISKGIDRYTSTFTPQTSPHTLLMDQANATGSFTSATQTANASVSEMGIVVLYKDLTGTASLNTDLVAQVSANGGTNYAKATLVAGGTFSTGIKIAAVSGVSVTAGTTPKYKISFANQSDGSKVTQVHGVALLY